MRQRFTRFLSLFMVIVMSASFLMVPVFAAGEEDPSSAGGTESGSVTAQIGSAEEPPVQSLEEEQPTVSEPPQPEYPQPEPPQSELPPGEVSAPGTAAGTDDPSGEGEKQEGEGDANQENTETFTVSYYDSDRKTLLKEETVDKDAAPTQAPSADAWLDADGKPVTLADVKVTENVSYYAWYKPQLLTSESSHTRYISGMGNGNFAPTSNLSRAEAATLLYRLLAPAEAGPYESQFTDVPSGEWYSDSISALASYGILTGRGNGKFSPLVSMRRAELVTVLVRITGATGSGTPADFTDTSTHWAKDSIAIAAEKGWISGYEQSDGTYTFKPNSPITRAEAVTVINRVLGRATSKDDADTAILSGEGIRHFLDVSEKAWYYYAVMEASIGHDCSASGSRESWSSYTRESSGLSAGFHQVGSTFCYIDSDSQPVKLEAGMNQLGSTYLYTSKAGYTASMDFSSGKLVYPSGKTIELEDGIQRIDKTYYFYWDGTKNAPALLTKGLNVINGRGYWADNDGFTIRGGLKAGTVVSLGGKNYMVNNSYSILTSGYAHDGEESYLQVVDLRNKNFEYGNYMYHAMNDYSLATDYWYGYLYFGQDCRYTSGDATLDGYVWSIVSPYVNLANQTQVQKLLAAYYKIRGGKGKYYGGSYGTSMFGYRAGGTIMRAGRYNGAGIYPDFITCAKEMYSTGSGRCFQWAAAYHYVVRRLGFQSYLVVGEVWSGRNVHCWNMIKWSNTWHISDIELEWGHLCGYYEGGKMYRNLFDIALPYESVSSYKHPECSLRYYFP